MKLTRDIWIDEDEVQFMKKEVYDSMGGREFLLLIAFKGDCRESIDFKTERQRDNAFSKFMKLKEGE